MPIQSTVNATITVKFEDQLTGPAKKAFDQLQQFAKTSFQAVGDSGVSAFRNIIAETDQLVKAMKVLPRGFQGLGSISKEVDPVTQNVSSLKKGFGDLFELLKNPPPTMNEFFTKLGNISKENIGPFFTTVGIIGSLVAGFEALGLAWGIILPISKALFAAFLPWVPLLTQLGILIGGLFLGLKAGQELGEIKMGGKPIKQYFGEAFDFWLSGDLNNKLETAREGAVDSMVGGAQAIATGVGSWFGKLSPIFDQAGQKVGELTGHFENMHKETVGNSYVPDMVDAIGFHFGRLDGVMVNPAHEATSLVTESFSIMGDNVARTIDDLIFKGETRFESFRDFSFNVLRDIQQALIQTTTGGQGIGGSIVSALGSLATSFFASGSPLSANLLGASVGSNFSSLIPAGGSINPGNIALTGSGLAINKFAHGGAFNVGGSGGTDSELVRFMATPGERVSVETPGQQKKKGDSIVNIHMDLRGSNGSQEIQQSIDKALRKAAPVLLDAAVWKVQDTYNRRPRYLR